MPIHTTHKEFVEAATLNGDSSVTLDNPTTIYLRPRNLAEAFVIGLLGTPGVPVRIDAYSVCHYLGHLQVRTTKGEQFQFYAEELVTPIPNLYPEGTE